MASWRTPAIAVIVLAAAGVSLAMLTRAPPALTSEQLAMRAATAQLPVSENWRRQPNGAFDVRVRMWRAGEEIAPRYLPLFDNNADGALSRRDVLFVKHLAIEGGRSAPGRVEIGPDGARRVWLGRRTPVKVVARKAFGLAKSVGEPGPKNAAPASPEG